MSRPTCSMAAYSIAFGRLGDFHRSLPNEPHTRSLYRKLLRAQWASLSEGLVDASEFAEWVPILNGPHWETLLKAYVIREQDENGKNRTGQGRKGLGKLA